MSTRSDDTFSFVAPVMPRRQVDPFALRLAVAAAVLVLLAGSFATFVIRHEQAADHARAELREKIATQQQAQADALLAQASAIDPEVVALLDEEAQRAATVSLGLAEEAFASSSTWAEAGPLQLTLVQPSLMYVDGPSTSPAVVSIHATRAGWGAAVMGPSGTCYWVTTSSSGVTRYGTGHDCTGRAAFAADAPAW
jgi:hypothetical protein